MMGQLGLAALESGVGFGQGSGLLGTLGNTLFPSMTAFGVRNSQRGFYGYPFSLPPIGSLVNAFTTGWFEKDIAGGDWKDGYDLFIKAMRWQGAALGNEGYNTTENIDFEPYKKLWNVILQSSYVKPGIRESFMGLLSGQLDNKSFNQMLMRNGAKTEDWLWLLPMIANRLSTDQVMSLWLRGQLTDDQTDTYLKQLQIGYPGDIQHLKKLAVDIPGPNDIIRFAVREAFNPQQIAALGLDKELEQNTDYLAWAKATGLGDVTIKTAEGKEISVNFAKLYWYAHWELPSPGQVYDFYHKYYKDSPYGPSPYLQYAKPFGVDDMRNLLKANDYSPAFRDHLAGAANLPYTRIDVRRIRAAGLINKADVYHNYRASGYDHIHADRLTEWVEQDVNNSATKAIKSGTKTEFCKAYQAGLADSQDFLAGLQKVNYTMQEATGELGLCDMRLANMHVSEVVKTVKKGYLTGAFDKFEASLTLKNHDIKQDRIDWYLEIWELMLKGTRKQVSTQMVVNWFLDGIISLAEFVSRLTKLQYFPEDVTRIVQAAQWEQAKRLARAQKIAQQEAQKVIERNLKEAEKARKAADALRRQQQRDYEKKLALLQKQESDRLRAFLSGRTEANLRSWLKEGTITDDDVRYTFNVRGWNPADIERWLKDAHLKGQ